MSRWRQWAIFSLNLVAAVGAVFILVTIYKVLQQQRDQIAAQKQQLTSAHEETQAAVESLRASQQAGNREVVSILRCQFILFGADRTKPVTADQLDACLAGTSLAPSPTPAPSASAQPTSAQPVTTAPKVQAQGSAPAPRTAPETGNTQSTKPPVSTAAPPPSPSPTLTGRLGQLVQDVTTVLLNNL